MKKLFRDLKAKTAVTLLLLVLCILLGVLVILERLNQDSTPPEIAFDAESVHLTDEEVVEVLKKDYSCLLSGVTAYDNEDGDISSRVIVYSVNVYEDNSYAVVSYRVLDKSGNMVSRQRLAYLKSPAQIYNELLDVALDEVAGMVDEWVSENAVGSENNSEKPVIEVERRVNLTVGEAFNPQEYLITLEDDRDSFETLLENCHVEGELDLNSPGVYPLAFYVTDSDGNESDAAVMFLTVSLDEMEG